MKNGVEQIFVLGGRIILLKDGIIVICLILVLLVLNLRGFESYMGKSFFMNVWTKF
ncbi:hypothetical protein REPUB_Repub12eG0006000 [Reevesia pubescens]